MKTNRLFKLNQDLEKYQQPSGGTQQPNGYATAATKKTKCKQMSEVEVEADEFVLDILEYFFHERLEASILTEELREMAAKVYWEAVKASKRMDMVPRPPGGKPGVLWLVSQAVQIAFRKANNQCIYKAVKDTVTVKWRSAYRIAVNNAKAGIAQSYLSQPMSTGNTALVVFMENTGSLPFRWPSSVPTWVRTALEKAIDYVSEEFVKWLNKFQAAQGRHYRKVIILEDRKATYDMLKYTLWDLAKKEFIIDVFTLAHGNSTSFQGSQGSISGTDLRKLRDDYGQPLPIRVVYQMNCEGAGLHDDWRYAGARAVAGAVKINYIPEPMMSKFWSRWKKGESFQNAVNGAYSDSERLIIKTISTVGGILSTLGGVVGYLTGGKLKSAVISRVRPLLADSKPKVEGNASLTISVSRLAAAKTLAMAHEHAEAGALVLEGGGGGGFDDDNESFGFELPEDTPYSEAAYGTGEHVLSGTVSEVPVSPTYKLDVNGVGFNYGELIAMGDLFESYDQMMKASKTELSRLQKLIDKSRIYYEGKVMRGSASGSNTLTAEWKRATGGRYLKLAENNYAHFAPSSSTLIPSYSSAKKNHKEEYQKYHQQAIQKARAGASSLDLEKALAINGFGDHFLTDAFAAGHLFNKDDLNSLFKSRVLTGGKVNSNGDKMLDEVANKAFTGKLKRTFSKYETYEPYKAWWNIFNWNPNIHKKDRFKALLKGILQAQPDILGKTVIAKIVHDKLNLYPGGVPVTNKMGRRWNLTGDSTLDKANLQIMQEAVKQSIRNVSDSIRDNRPAGIFVQKVWDYTPVPTRASQAMMKNLIKKYTNPLDNDLTTAIAKVLQNNYQSLLDELVKRKILKKA